MFGVAASGSAVGKLNICAQQHSVIIFIIYINTKKYTHIQASYYIQIIYMINTI